MRGAQPRAAVPGNVQNGHFIIMDGNNGIGMDGGDNIEFLSVGRGQGREEAESPRGKTAGHGGNIEQGLAE